MPIHNIAFYSILFFLLGVLLAGLKLNIFLIGLIVVSIAIFFLFLFYKLQTRDYKEFAILSFAIIIGSIYFSLINFEQENFISIPFGKKDVFKGIIVNYPTAGESQNLKIKLEKPFSGIISAKLKSYPSFEYGDLISLEGTINKLSEGEYANYLAKEGISGIIDFPKVKLLDKNKASKFRHILFNFRKSIVADFQKTLNYEQAAFLSGIILGERAEFSKEFKKALNKSGTTHLVALSGYNITIIATAVLLFFGSFLRREKAFLAAILTILAFVLMTGAEASVVRAAIMTGIMLLAQQIGRLYSIRNAIVVTAFFMILLNPKILNFDLGFQLSFAALIGIVYLAPIIRSVLRIKEESGFFGWRENFLNTASAQFMVLPLLVINFGGFSVISLLSNVLILGLIPLTMFLGFLIAVFGIIFMPLAIILGWFTSLFLSYELFIINLFGKIPLFDLNFGFWGILLYYLLIVGFIFFIKFKNDKKAFCGN